MLRSVREGDTRSRPRMALDSPWIGEVARRRGHSVPITPHHLGGRGTGDGKKDHDGAYKKLFEHPLMIESLLEGFVSAELSESLDYASMTPVNVEFRSRALQKRASDMILKIPRDDGEAMHLMLMLEFQSTVDHKMPIRVSSYAPTLYEQILMADGATAATILPPVLPIVLHTGSRTWTARGSVLEMIDVEAGSKLEAYQPDLMYYLLDTRRIGADVLEGTGGPASLLFELERVTRREDLESCLDLIKQVFSVDRELGELFIVWMENVLGRGREEVMLSDEQLREVTEEVVMLRETVERWERELIAEGREEGREEGRREAVRLVVRKLLSARFGEVEVRDEKVSALSDEQVDEVLERLVKLDEYPDEASVFVFE